MSFRDLRTSRLTKQTRSFVKPKTDPTAPNAGTSKSTISVSPLRYANSDSSSEQGFHKAQLVGGASYPLIPETLEIRKSTETGRGIYTKQDFIPGMPLCPIYALRSEFIHNTGSILISIKPHVSTLSTPYLDSYCSSCIGPAPATELKRCTRCRTVWYCGTVCTSGFPHDMSHS